MQSLRLKLAAGVAVLGVAGVATAAVAHDRSRFDASLIGYEETPAISTNANGVFRAAISRSTDEIKYVLSYGGGFNVPTTPPGQTAPGTATQAHIHLGQEGVAGGISVWLCANAPITPPPGTPPVQACPPNGGTITGTIRPADVIGPAAQGISTGEFAELVRALRAGVTYANVHTTGHPGGEIRGQISDKDDDRGHEPHDH